MTATSSDPNCAKGYGGTYTGTGFDGCWNFEILNDGGAIGVDSTKIAAWQWLPLTADRWTVGSQVDVCMFEETDNFIIKGFTLTASTYTSLVCSYLAVVIFSSLI